MQRSYCVIIPGPGSQYATYTRHVDKGEATREECTILFTFDLVAFDAVELPSAMAVAHQQGNNTTTHNTMKLRFLNITNTIEELIECDTI